MAKYFKRGTDVFEKTTTGERHVELPEFKQLGLNYALLPEESSQIINEEMNKNGQDSFGLDNKSDEQLQGILDTIQKQMNQGQQNQTSNLDILNTAMAGLKPYQQSVIDIQKKIAEKEAGYEGASNVLSEQLAPQPFITGQQAALEKRRLAEMNALTGQQQVAQSGLEMAQNQAGLQYQAGVADLTAQQGQTTNLLGYLKDIFGIKQTQLEQKKFEQDLTKADIREVGDNLVQVGTDGTIKVLYSAPKNSTSNTPALIQAVLQNPELFNQLTPTQKGLIAPQLNALGFTNFGKALSDTAIQNIAQTQYALTSLSELKTLVQDNIEYIGPLSGLQRYNPWSKARQIQADIDRVRQTVGKALEGGVLRKEDEEKYKKILATLADTPETAIYKIDQLINSVQNQIDAYTSLQAASGRNMPTSEQSTTGQTSTGNKFTVEQIGQ